jgi:8-oxo-dGTP pyrophosphatase MutT (NUDIX family)
MSDAAVPPALWRTPSFQRWLQAQTSAGNELRAARLEWTFEVGDRVFFWALHVELYVAAERRMKTNELVLSRPDIASVLAYRRAASLLDTEIVLVREFRSTASSSDGFVLELPGGSHPEPIAPLELAAAEFFEETGVRVALERLVPHGSRQLAATVSAHHQYLFSVELTADELNQLRPVHAGTEITYPSVRRLGDLIAGPEVDWTTLGAITQLLPVLDSPADHGLEHLDVQQ